jgi:hypothetical protein
MTERLEERRILFPNFPAPLNGQFHSITIRETIMRIALEVILTTPEVDGAIARDIAREALQEAFPLKARGEVEHDLSEIYHFETQRRRRDWPKSSENAEEHMRLHEEVMAYLGAIREALTRAGLRRRGGQ